jgi:hypothetical protein
VSATKSVRVTVMDPVVPYCEAQGNQDPWGAVIAVLQMKEYMLGDVSGVLDVRFRGTDLGQQVTESAA